MIMLRVFLSTLSLRRATAARSAQDAKTAISIHALLAESDGHRSDRDRCWRGISIHALLAESDECWPQRYLKTGISIHALLAESDSSPQPQLPSCLGFLSTLSLRRATKQPFSIFYGRAISIHALLAESDLTMFPVTVTIFPFLSTLSLRRATHGTCPGLFVGDHFYPRSPCGERLQLRKASDGGLIISIHALLAESDRLYSFYRHHFLIFLSTLSLRRATR